jgi:hypothetical protein
MGEIKDQAEERGSNSYRELFSSIGPMETLSRPEKM